MSDRPILFSAPMVRALLAGTKTQTRRILPTMETCGRTEYPGRRDKRGISRVNWLDTAYGMANAVRECRYGQPGDRLWVRETWGYIDPDCSGEDHDDGEEGPGPTTFCDELLLEGHPLRDFWRRRLAYRASWQDPKYGIGPDAPKRWRPSIHMPRWASRITLEVTAVRVERLQDISEADAIAEGCNNSLHLPGGRFANENYRHLWWQINGDGSWEANPWVWVVEFKRVAS